MGWGIRETDESLLGQINKAIGNRSLEQIIKDKTEEPESYDRISVRLNERKRRALSDIKTIDGYERLSMKHLCHVMSVVGLKCIELILSDDVFAYRKRVKVYNDLIRDSVLGKKRFYVNHDVIQPDMDLFPDKKFSETKLTTWRASESVIEGIKDKAFMMDITATDFAEMSVDFAFVMSGKIIHDNDKEIALSELEHCMKWFGVRSENLEEAIRDFEIIRGLKNE